MACSTSVLSTVSSDTEPTIVLDFGGKARYIFNAGENVSRAFVSSKLTWRSTAGVFMTSVNSQRGGGLAGLLMCLGDTGVGKTSVIGPPGTLHFLAQMRYYLYRNNLYVDAVEADSFGKHGGLQPAPVYHDDNLRVYGIPLTAASADASEVAEAGKKRKRASSEEPVSKRGKRSADGDAQELSLVERAKQPDFDPEALTGDDAQTWRRLIISSLFMKQKPKPKPKGKRGGPGQGEETEEPEEPPASGIDRSLGPHRDSPLPKFDASQRTTLCYVCVGMRTRGKFDSEKAKALQIPNGPCRAALSSGKTIKFMVSDGKGGKVERTVAPEEVLGPAEAPKVMMIFDVPTRDHIPSLISAFETSPFYRTFLGTEHADEHVVSVIYHLCGEGVLEDERYKALMHRFAPDVHHLVASREHCPDPVTFTSVAYYQARMNQLDPEMFPMPQYRLQPRKYLSDVPGLPTNTVAMYANLHLTIKPPGVPQVGEFAQDLDLFHSAVKSTAPIALPESVQRAFQTARECADEAVKDRESAPGDDVVVAPLGTSSAVPSKYRNVSSTLIQTPNDGNILLDCGEGTWGQLIRLFGDDPARESGVWAVLRDLKCIFISHGHGDHHIGTAKVLAMRQKLGLTQPLFVVSIRPVLMYLHDYQEIEDIGMGREDGSGVQTVLSDCIRFDHTYTGYGRQKVMPFQDRDLNQRNHSALCDALGLTEFSTVNVDHGCRAYGLVFKHKDGWKISFSGDTRPTLRLCDAGRFSTLLIHEATMEDDQAEMAYKKAHSTLAQATTIGRKMHATNLLLTHFSARYPRLPRELTPTAPVSPGGTRAPVLALAFDHMRVRLRDFARLRAYMPALQQNLVDVAATDKLGEEELDPIKMDW